MKIVSKACTLCSKWPFYRQLIEKVGAKLLKTEDAIKSSHLVVMCVPKDFYEKQPLHLLEGKTVIDVSNRSTTYRKMEQSQAEYLQSLLPRSAVVKAFNVLSAYALENGGLQGIFQSFHLYLLFYGKKMLKNATFR